MRSRNRELEVLADEVLAKLNAQLLRPLNEVASFFEWLRRQRFRSDANARMIIEALRAGMPQLERTLYGEPNIIANLRSTIPTLRRQITDLANKELDYGN